MFAYFSASRLWIGYKRKGGPAAETDMKPRGEAGDTYLHIHLAWGRPVRALGQKLPLLGLDHLCCSSAECSLPSQASWVLGVSGWVEALGRTKHSVSHVIVSEDAPWSQGAMGDMDFRNHQDWIPILLSAHLPQHHYSNNEPLLFLDHGFFLSVFAHRFSLPGILSCLLSPWRVSPLPSSLSQALP